VSVSDFNDSARFFGCKISLEMEASMRSSPCKPLSLIALIAALAALLSGWTCSGMFVSCQGISQAQITSLSPGNIPRDVNSVPLTVNGNGFTPQSQILWNGSTLETTFLDSHRLQATITRETFESFGNGSTVRISVSQGSGCPINGNSATLDLVIN
jgi:hypothetical protein